MLRRFYREIDAQCQFVLMFNWFLQLIRLLELTFDNFLFCPGFIFVGFVVGFFGGHSEWGYD